MSKEKCFIELRGCDADTLIDIELDDIEIKLLEKIEEKSKKTSTYSCMPTLRLIKGEEAKKLEDEIIKDMIEDWY